MKKRSRQYCVTCPPGEWEAIRKRADAAGMKISRFVVACALDDEEDSPQLVLTGEEQRDLYHRTNLLLLAVQDLLAPFPGTGVTPRQAMEFLYRSAREPSGHQSVIPGIPDGDGQ